VLDCPLFSHQPCSRLFIRLAWDPAGFCPYHGPDAVKSPEGASANGDDSSVFSPELVHRVRGVVPACVDWLVKTVAANAEEGYRRAHPKKSKDRLRKTMSGVTDGSGTAENTGDDHASPSRSLSLPQHANDIGLSDSDEDDDWFFHDHMQTDSGDLSGQLTTLTRAHVFSPNAASTAGDKTTREEQSKQDEMAEKLGRVGAKGQGLYLVLFAGDIHSDSQRLEALKEFLGTSYYQDPLVGKFVMALKQYGHLVIWGTREMIAECGTTQVRLWMDGDKVACTRIGAVILERARRLIKHGLFCSIVTGEELMVEQRAVYVLQWLSAVARSCDPLCQTVAECILPNRHLVPLLRADFKMSARVTKAWYSLLLTLLAVPTFKSHLAAAYCDTYRNVTAKYARGMGVLERSGYTLSVQFLNRVTYVVDLVQGRDLLGKLGKAMLDTLRVACLPHRGLNPRLDPNHSVLTNRRYAPCVSDLKCVLNVKGMPRIFACKEATFLDDWVSSLSLAQLMDPHVWRHWSEGHVENESRGWVGAFNASISLGSLFERLLGWSDDEISPIKDPSSPYSRELMSCAETTFFILSTGVKRWQVSEMVCYDPTGETSDLAPQRRASCSLPFSTVAAKRGTCVAMKQLPISQVTPFSFHLPLHRFVSSCFRELCLRIDEVGSGMRALREMVEERLSPKERDYLFRGLMEFPLLVLCRACQIRAGLWKRNGPGLIDQVMNYAEPPFCRTMRDADLLMVQFSVLGRTYGQSPMDRPNSDVGVSFLVNTLLHRLGIFDFLGFAEAPRVHVNRYQEEMKQDLFPSELSIDSPSKGDVSLPWTYSPSRETAMSLVLLEEFLHFLIVFSSEIPLPAPENRAEHTKQSRWKLYREVVHRLASGPKTHSELSEVQHVLSHWDNNLLSEEGKLINPDDAAGAALGSVLSEIAERKFSRTKLEPDKWEMKRTAWDSYDPAFFHISQRCHQTAAENRPKPRQNESSSFGWEARPYTPKPSPGHVFFRRLRRDVTADSTVLASVYRVLHLHCRPNDDRELGNLRGKSVYESKEKSETALARAVHLLTLGAYAWMEENRPDLEWRVAGGGSAGSIFFDRGSQAPTASDWVSEALLAEPSQLSDCEWFEGEETSLLMLQRLAKSGGETGGFVAQDPAVRSGAAWLCEFAAKVCPEASSILSPNKIADIGSSDQGAGAESETDRRKRLAKEKAMARMKAQAAKFASMMEVDLKDSDQEEIESHDAGSSSAPSTPREPIRSNSIGSALSSASSVYSSMSVSEIASSVYPLLPLSSSKNKFSEDSPLQKRLLQGRPRCIICNCEETADSGEVDELRGEGQRKRSRRRNENALGFVGYVQPSTVLKGGGGPPKHVSSPMSTVGNFVGTHVALCGHAVHSECCESYLSSVSHREDRAVGKRDEFRCPLCQRLSNCLVPFIDVGIDWAETLLPLSQRQDVVSDELEGKMEVDVEDECYVSLHEFLSRTPWWVARYSESVEWDGQSAFIYRGAHQNDSISPLETADLSNKPEKTKRPGRSLKKKDVYSAWNAMMKTPRFVRRRLRPRGASADETAAVPDLTMSPPIDTEESAGETIVWRRFMDQISDMSYRADSKRLGDAVLRELFGEFRHYVTEKYSYNIPKQSTGNPVDVSDRCCLSHLYVFLCSRPLIFFFFPPLKWPSCLFSRPLPEGIRQEMSREKLLSKLLLTIQSLTYSSCCEAYEARRIYRKSLSSSSNAAGLRQDYSTESILSRYGISDVICDGRLVVMPRPLPNDDDGSQPFNGRLGRLRWLALAAMSAAGAVSADLVQLVIPFPLRGNQKEESASKDQESPLRAPIVYPILFGHVLTHVVAAMCATCGRGRALSDSLDLTWSVPFSSRGSFSLSGDKNDANTYKSVAEDCEGFMTLGLLARLLQVLLGRLKVPERGFDDPELVITGFESLSKKLEENLSVSEMNWINSCYRLIRVALNSTNTLTVGSFPTNKFEFPSTECFQEACAAAAVSGCNFLSEAGVMLQLLIPGIGGRYGWDTSIPDDQPPTGSSIVLFDRLRLCFRLQSLDEMLDSNLTCEVLNNWYAAAVKHAEAGAAFGNNPESEKNLGNALLRRRLFRTNGFRYYDWPAAGMIEFQDRTKTGEEPPGSSTKSGMSIQEPHEDAAPMQIDTLRSTSGSHSSTTTVEVLRSQISPSLVTFSSKKSVPLLGGFAASSPLSKCMGLDDALVIKSVASARPRVTAIPTSYTDLYAELGTLLPDCEQTAVCLICGEVLNAGGKNECTKHTLKCGAGAGMFFLLQECSGLIMHKAQAAYIHSPYVDSHGETPQFRGRPLNLDLVRYEHLREIWMGHAIRQTVVAERSSSRQVILTNFY